MIRQITVEDVLLLGQGLGFTWVDEAYTHVCRYYDLFFDLGLYIEQSKCLVEEMKATSLTRIEEGGLAVVEERITDAMCRLNIPIRVGWA